MRRDEAAASLGVSPTTFDEWVADGKMPKGTKIGGIRLWDTDQVRTYWLNLRDAEGEDEGDNPFNRVTA